jgi:hypothetical protein
MLIIPRGERYKILGNENIEGRSSAATTPPLSPPAPPRLGSGDSSDTSEVLEANERRRYYAHKVLKLRDFDDAFELVKFAVEEKFKMHRAGLSLVLQGLPGSLGAYHVLGSNMIIVNRRILNLIKDIKTTVEYNSFLFTVLTHEYLHSFGITDEFRVRNMTHEICKSLLGDGHPATLMARYEPWSVFPELRSLQNSFDHRFELIKEFDKGSHSYIA